MIPSVGDVMREVNNYFESIRDEGLFTIRGGVLSPSDWLLDGDWIAVSGARRASGVHCLETGKRLPGCADECFRGEVWALSPPPAFLALCEEIAAWCRTQPSGSVRRESFGGYSRELTADAQGKPLSWQKRFEAELRPYRRMYAGVTIR